MMSAQTHFSHPMETPTSTIDIDLELEDVDFVKMQLLECREKLNNPLFREAKVNPYVKILAVIQEALHVHSAATLTGQLRKQLEAKRDESAR